MLKRDMVKEVWNVELSKVSLKDSKEIYLKKNLDSQAKFIFSDGFQDIPLEGIKDYREIIIVLAGLGSKKIISILNGLPDLWKNKKLWLCCLPHAHPNQIKKWSETCEWDLLIEEEMTFKEKIYSIFLFSLKKLN
ncbi:SAM-dependent methyltransferase [Mycoplasma ovis str. Michigan]|uniref:SAM-dependent methyltransferase n=1 Tax=Mycoplasma ovis str. Michigan TaxID=1415773 RepID=A0ABM5P0F9_9MOLU|nr:SAM-dependent methyltransferase [Mycoplasma ovis str. Michigan]